MLPQLEQTTESAWSSVRSSIAAPHCGQLSDATAGALTSPRCGEGCAPRAGPARGAQPSPHRGLVSAPAVASLSCPQCGAAIELRTLDQALSVVCSSCGSILDARDPNLHVLQEFKSRQKFTPQIPLGTRGTLK